MAGKRSLICGVGINDADYVTQPRINGKQIKCPFYTAWHSMINRCYNAKLQRKQPAYVGCTTSIDWHSFMAFKSWMQVQNWQGNALDKDLLVDGNKIYSPDTCVFVDFMTNNFLTDRAAARGDWLIGASFEKKSQKFTARCSNPFTKKIENLGLFISQQHASEAWRKRKHELALQLANMQTDERAAKALRVRYLPT